MPEASPPFLIDTFLANVRKKGFAKPNRFVPLIVPNDNVAKLLGYKTGIEIAHRLAISCFSASMQSKSFMTHEFGVTHPNRLIPYAINTNNSSGMSMEFYCMGDYFEKEFFHNWMSKIIDPWSRTVSYYDEFAKGSEITVIMLPNGVGTWSEINDRISNGSSTAPLPGFTFTEVYPYLYTYNGGSVNYGTNAAPATVKVDFMYRDMIPFNSRPPSPSTIDEAEDTGFEASIFKKNVINMTLEDQLRAEAEYAKSLNTIDEERRIILEQYNQTNNIPRGVDGQYLNPPVDGLPAANPNDRIRNAIFSVSRIVTQLKGFGVL